MYVCVYVRVYVCMYVCMHVCMYVCMYFLCMHICLFVCMYVYMYVCVCALVHTRACAHICMYEWMNVCKWKHVCPDARACACQCVDGLCAQARVHMYCSYTQTLTFLPLPTRLLLPHTRQHRQPLNLCSSTHKSVQYQETPGGPCAVRLYILSCIGQGTGD